MSQPPETVKVSCRNLEKMLLAKEFAVSEQGILQGYDLDFNQFIIHF